MRSNLAPLRRDQSKDLATFRSSGEAELLVRLAQTECLLALARMSPEESEPGAYAELALGVLSQFVPMRYCGIEFDGGDLPARSVSLGPAREPAIQATVTAELHVDGEPVGRLELVPAAPEVAPGEFVAKVAEQLSTNLASVVRTVRSRRDEAVSRALRLADGLADGGGIEAAQGLVRAVVAIPGVLGARLTLTSGVPVEAGEPPAEGGCRPGLAVSWSSEATEGDRAAVDSVRAGLEQADGRRVAQDQLRAEAETDPLTGVGNRRRSARALAEAEEGAAEGRGPVLLLYLDLDHFKRVNDALGHEIGDRILARFAGGVRSDVRSSDTLCRQGGEEFLLVCPGMDAARGLILGQRIVERTPMVCAPLLPDGWVQTVSIGLAVFPVNGSMRDTVLAADQALYAAKRAGRNRVEISERSASGMSIPGGPAAAAGLTGAA